MRVYPFAGFDLRRRAANREAVLPYDFAFIDRAERDLVSSGHRGAGFAMTIEKESVTGFERIDRDRDVVIGVNTHDTMTAGGHLTLLPLDADRHAAGSARESFTAFDFSTLSSRYVSRARS